MKKNKFYYLFLLIVCVCFCGCREELDLGLGSSSKNDANLQLQFLDSQGIASVRSEAKLVASVELKDNIDQITRFDSLEVVGNEITLTLSDGEYKIISLKLADEVGLKYGLSKENKSLDVTVSNGAVLTKAAILMVQYSSYPFDWENVIHVSNDPSLPILPWLSGASTSVSRVLSTDNKAEDGWVLLHNSFKLTTGGSDTNKYLLFYNKYSGTLRMWYWYEGTNSYGSLKYALQIPYVDTSLFNFNHEFAQPMSVRQPGYLEFISGSPDVVGSEGITRNHWYLFDFEIAYDSQAASTARDRSDLFISARGINMTSVELSGSQTGKINGNIVLNSTPTSGLFNLSNLVFNINGTTNTVNNSVSMVVKTGDSADWKAKVGGKVSSTFSSAFNTFSTALATKGASIAVKTAASMLNSLVHRQTSTTGVVDLALNTQISMQGTLTSQQPVSITNLHLPGMNTPPDGLVYLYDNPLGVFNLTATPVVKWEQIFYNSSSRWRHFQYYQIDRTSFQMVINPAILNDITIITQQTSLMFYKRYEGTTRWESGWHTDETELWGYQQLLFSTTPRSGGFSMNDGYEFYHLEEGRSHPMGDDEFGLIFTDKNGRIGEWHHGYMNGLIPADKRVVVKAALKFRINSTGREVTIIKTYLPTFVKDQRLPNNC